MVWSAGSRRKNRIHPCWHSYRPKAVSQGKIALAPARAMAVSPLPSPCNWYYEGGSVKLRYDFFATMNEQKLCGSLRLRNPLGQRQIYGWDCDRGQVSGIHEHKIIHKFC